MSSEFSGEKLKEWIEKAIQKSKNPDPNEKRLEEIKRIRKKNREKVEKQYGF